MKTKFLALSLAAALPFAASADGWYFGAGFGTASSSDFEAALFDDGSFTSSNVDDSDTAMRVFGGYDFHDNWSFEFGYTDLGEARLDAVSDGTGLLYAAGAVTAVAEVDGFDLSLVGKYPLGDSFSITGRLGVYMWDTSATIADTTLSVSASSSGSDLFYGIGFGYDFNDSWGITGEYTMYTLDISDATAMSLGVTYRFGN